MSWTRYDADDFNYYRFVVCDDSQYNGSSCNGTVYKSDAVFDGSATGPYTVPDLAAGDGYGVILQVWRSGGAGALKVHAALPAPSLTVTDVTATTATVTIGNWSGAWYYRTESDGGGQQHDGAGGASGGPSCSGPVNGSQITLSGLDPNATQTLNAYEGQGCAGAAMASSQFQTLSDAPAAPASVVGYRGNTFIDVEWTAVSEATSYDVDIRHENVGTPDRAFSGVTGTSARIPGLANTGRFYVYARANNANGSSAWTASARVPVAVAPLKPTAITTVRQGATFTVSWTQCDMSEDWCNGASPVTGYLVEIKAEGVNSWTRTHTLTAYTSGQSLTVSNADAGKGYGVRVKIENRMGGFWTSKNASAPPGAPTNFTVSTTTSGSAVTSALQWQRPAAASGALGYQVQCQYANDSTWTDCKTVAPTTDSSVTATVTSTTANRVTDVRGRATASGSLSPWAGPVPAAPASVVGYRGNTFIDVEWTAVSDATSYDVNIRHENVWTPVRAFSGVSGTSARITGLANLGRFYVYVRANNANGSSAWTASARVPTATAPIRPTAVTTVRGGSTFTVSWTQCDVSEAWCNGASPVTGYLVEIRAAGANNWTRAHTLTTYTSGQALTLGNTDDGTGYDVRVKVENRMGGFWVSVSAGPYVAASALTVDLSAAPPTLTLSGHTAGGHTQPWWLKADEAPYDATCRPVEAGTATFDLDDLVGQETYVFKAYDDSACGAQDLLATAASFLAPGAVLRVSGVYATGATLSIAGHTGNWYFKESTAPTNTCRGAVSGNAITINDLLPNLTYTYAAYSDAGCAVELATANAFTTPKSLTASNVTVTSATLTLDGHTGNWYYKADRGPDLLCQGPVGGNTESLTGLTYSTTYTYQAFSNAACGDDGLMAATTFTTPAPTPGSRDSDKDFDTLAAAGNTSPEGVWSNGTTMWVSDSRKVFAYDLATQARDAAKDVSLDASKPFWEYITSNGVTMWLSESTTTNELYAYNLATGARDHNQGLFLQSYNEWPQGLWTDGVTMWVLDRTDKKIYAYSFATRKGVTGKTITLDPNADGGDPSGGLWSDGVTMWVSDSTGDKLWAYKLSDGSRDAGKDYDNLDSDNRLVTGIWSDGTTMWMADYADGKLYAYHAIAPGAKLTAAAVASTTATLYLGAHTGAWWYKQTSGSGGVCTSVSAGTRTAALGSLTAGTSYTYTAYGKDGCANADELAAVTFSTPASGTAIGTATVVAGWRLERDDGGVLRVTTGTSRASAAGRDPSSRAGRPRSQAAEATGARRGAAVAGAVPASGSLDPASDVTALAAAGNTSPDGLWSDGATLWVVDTDDRMLYAYDLASKARDVGKDVVLWRNTRPLGLASDGVTLWVSDYQAGTVYAYPVPGAASAPGPDVTLHAANASPSALWTDGATLWVAEDTDGRLYAYDLSSGLRAPGKDLTLHADNASSGGLWSDGGTMWVSDPEDGRVYAYRLSDGRQDARLDYDVGGAAMSVYGLWSDGWTLWVVDDGADRVVGYRAH